MAGGAGRVALALGAFGWLADAWDYATNGNNWREGVCANPKVNLQSPIDFADDGVQLEPDKAIWFRYPGVGEPVRLVNSGKSLSVTLPDNYKGGFNVGPTKNVLENGTPLWRIYQLNFHSPSEHTHDGERFPLEMQLVHKDVKSHRVAVVSVLYTNGGQPSPILDVLREKGLPKEPWDEVFVNNFGELADRPPGPHAKDIDLRYAVNGSGYYTYTGSLTIPPCEGNVLYYVRQNPRKVAKDQLDEFAEVLRDNSPPRGNYRNTQPLNKREVKLVSSTDLFDPDRFLPVKLPSFVKPGPPPLITDADVINNPKMTEIYAEDSDALRAAKMQVNLKEQTYEASRTAQSAAAQEAAKQQGKYDGATGPVGRMDQYWKKTKANRIAKGAAAGEINAKNAYRVAVDNAKSVLTAEAKATSTTADPGSDASVAEGGEDEASGDQVPTVFPPYPTAFPNKTLHYQPRLRLPRGDAANPFLDERAEKEARIGDEAGMMPMRYERYAASLRQPLGPPGQYPIPSLRKVTTAPPTTAAPTTTLNVTQVSPDGGQIDLEPGTTEDEAKTQIAAALGVSPDQVELTDEPPE